MTTSVSSTGPMMNQLTDAAKHSVQGSDFDQTLERNGSGVVLIEMPQEGGSPVSL